MAAPRPLASPPLAAVRRRPSSAGHVSNVQRNRSPSVGSTEGTGSTSHINGSAKERPGTAPSGRPRRTKKGGERRLQSAPPQTIAAGNGEATSGIEGGPQRRLQVKERGLSARVVEARLDELRADDTLRQKLLEKVNGIVQRRGRHKVRVVWEGQRRVPRTRKGVQLELERVHPLDAERKANLVELLRSGGLEANRATQVLLDPATKAVLIRRANAGRRARETRIRNMVSSCQRHLREQRLAARANEAIKDLKIRARRERTRQARGRLAQAKGWLVVLKTHAACNWAAGRLDNVEEERSRSNAARVITRHIAAVARHRYKLRVEAATRIIDTQFAKKIRRWKTKRDAEATAVLERFLTDVRSSDVRTRVKLLAYRVAQAHVQLARLQRWWRRRRRELKACQRVMCRLWELEVDRRVDAQVEEIWRARNEPSLISHDNNNHHHHNHLHHEDVLRQQVVGSEKTTSGTLRWGVVRQTQHSVSAPSGGGSVASASLREAFHGTGKGKAARHAREEQARGEKATIRGHLLLDSLMNPPADLKARMCREYVKQRALRHAEALEEFHERVRDASERQTKMSKAGDEGSLLAVSLAVQARRKMMRAKGVEIAGMPMRPQWRTGALPGEVTALVDAGIEYISGIRWMWEPRTPSRLEDGSLLVDSMPTPEDLARRVASRFRYAGSKLKFQGNSVFSALGIEGGATMAATAADAAMGWRGRSNKHTTSGPSDNNGVRVRYAAAVAGAAFAARVNWLGEAGEGLIGVQNKRAAPMFTYHYLPSASSYNLHRKHGVDF